MHTFVEGRNVTDTGLFSSLGSLKDIHIFNFIYAYEKLDETTILLEHNNIIYMGYMTEDYFEKYLHSKDNGIHVYICHKKCYPDTYGAQTVTLLDGTIITILYDGVLHYTPVIRPTPVEINFYVCVAFASHNSWDPILIGTFLQLSNSTPSSYISAIELINLNNYLEMTNMVSA